MLSRLFQNPLRNSKDLYPKRIRTKIYRLYGRIRGMERRERQIGFEKSTIQSPTFREWLLAVLIFPVTIQRLAEGINRLVKEMEYYRQIPQCLIDLDEVWRDLNAGIYSLFGGRVNYKRSDRAAPDPDFKLVKH